MAAATKECDTFWTAVHETPLQWCWLRTKGFSPRENLLCMIKGHAYVSWTCGRNIGFLAQGLMLGAPCHHVTLTTDASLTGWGAVMSGRSAQGLWEGHHLTWHNKLPGDAGHISISETLPSRPVGGHHVLVRTRQHIGGLLHQPTVVSAFVPPFIGLAHWISCGLREKLLSLRAVYIPGFLNQGVDIFSRQALRPGNGGSTPRWWSSSGKSSTRRKWIYLLHKKRHTVHSGSPSYIQLHLGWMQWCRRQVKSPLFI